VIPEPRKLRQSLRISVDDLRLGMFISELDRPWTQTPFMLQGFLLAEPLDWSALRSLVRELVIDPSRSASAALSHLPWDILHEPSAPQDLLADDSDPAVRMVYASAPLAALEASWFSRAYNWFRMRFRHSPKPSAGATAAAQSDSVGSRTQKPPQKSQPVPYYLRYAATQDGAASAARQAESKAAHTSALAPPSNLQFSQLIHSLYPRDVIFAPLDWLERFQKWHERHRRYTMGTVASRAMQKRSYRRRPKYLPKSIMLVVYRDENPIEHEIVNARSLVARTDEVLNKLADDIDADRSITLQEIRPAVELLSESVIANPSALMWLVRMRSENKVTYAHGLKVAVYLMALGRHLGFPRQQLIELGCIGLLLDIGKLKLPRTLLEKRDKLSMDEDVLMRQHVAIGVNILEAAGPLTQHILLGINEHHERLDGSGYPHGLSGEAISIYGRMAAIADCFAAMTSARTYDITRSAFDALKELFKEAGTRLHAPLVEEFVQAISIFPVGSMIELSSGEVAVVVEHNKIRRLEPKVLLLTDPDKTSREKPIMLDLMAQNKNQDAETMKILRGLPDGAYNIDCRDFYLG
jgi:HD-GYP domain-containing protein (c-di-GMP phosphodiesterase class II)